LAESLKASLLSNPAISTASYFKPSLPVKLEVDGGVIEKASACIGSCTWKVAVSTG
jgi:hypothetical protein